MAGFTDDQTNAIDTRHCNLLVSAAAGSGKTAVLVERIIRIITNTDEPVDIDRLLVVTFTEAAASEMRGRILDAISQRLATEPESEHLRRQEMLLGKAMITTIHSFCLAVIRKYFYLIDIDPNFRIIDGTEAELLKAEVMRSFFEDLYENDHKLMQETFGYEDNACFLRLVDSYGDKVKDDSLQELAMRLYGFVQSSPWPEAWLDENVKRLEVDCIEELEQSGWYAFLLEDIRETVHSVLATLRILKEMCRQDCVNPESLQTLTDDEAKAYTILDSLDKGINVVYDAFSFAFAKLKLAGGKSEEITDEIKEYRKQISDLRNKSVKEPIEKIKKKAFFLPLDELAANISESSVNIRTLCGIVKGFSRRYNALKRARNIADFGDFEHLCIKALVAEGSTPGKLILTEASRELRERFVEVLTDEYQDSNLVQEIILSAVSRQGEGTENRFIVGDIKQSIYKFRMASPELFIEKYISYHKNTTGKEVRIDLSKNFRSRKNVLESINFIFKQIMSEKLGEVAYDESAYLYYGASYPEKTNPNENKTEVMIIELQDGSAQLEEQEDAGEEEVVEANDLLAELTSAELEAKTVAKRIAELMGRGDSVFQVTREDGGFRNIEFRDIVILLRSSRNVSQTYMRELKKLDIPSFSDSAGGYFEAIEVMTMLSLLRVIDNPRQDIHLIAVLYSPLYLINSDGLVSIRKCLDKGMFYDCVLHYLESGEQEELKIKLQRFKEDLLLWRSMAVHSTISSLIWEIYKATGYGDIVSVMPGGKIRRANLTALFERAVKFENTRLKGLFHFIRYIEKLQNSSAEFGDAKIAGENDNVVRIMNIHKSKGLEFPVVFVCGLGKGFNLTDSRSNLLLHQGFGFGAMHVDLDRRIRYNTLPRYAISRKIELESISEDMRVLYVALTRAKEKLILVGTYKRLAKKITEAGRFLSPAIPIPSDLLAKNKTYMSWIVLSLLRHREAGRILWPDGEGAVCDELYHDLSQWQVSILSNANAAHMVAEEANTRLKLLKKLAALNPKEDYSGQKKDIFEILSYHYEGGIMSSIPSKISISEIKRLHYEYVTRDSEDFESRFVPEAMKEIQFEPPTFLSQKAPEQKPKTGMSEAAKRGTLLHCVMEHLDVHTHRTKEDIEALIQELTKRNIFSVEDARLVDIEKIVRFTNHFIAERMRQSGKVLKEIPFVLGMEPGEIKAEWKQAKGEIVLVHGIIDCIFYEEEEIVLLDYKSDKVYNGDINRILERYKIQMSIYQRAVEAYTGKKVKQVLIYLFDLNQCVEIVSEIHYPLAGC